MVRAVLYILLAIIVITLLRSIIGVVGKAVAALFEPNPNAGPGDAEPRNAGELKRDPVCGTYVSTATSVKKTIDGRVVHFCSPGCSSKYKT
jgi:YHS domain-containing protein